MGSIVTVPNITQIGKAEPYISVETFKDDPLSNSLDLSQLVEGGSQSAQDSAIQRMIYRASAKIDNHTCGPTGTLNATQVTKQGQSFVNREGCVTVNPGEPRLLRSHRSGVGLPDGRMESKYRWTQLSPVGRRDHDPNQNRRRDRDGAVRWHR